MDRAGNKDKQASLQESKACEVSHGTSTGQRFVDGPSLFACGFPRALATDLSQGHSFVLHRLLGVHHLGIQSQDLLNPFASSSAGSTPSWNSVARSSESLQLHQKFLVQPVKDPTFFILIGTGDRQKRHDTNHVARKNATATPQCIHD